MTGVKLDKFYKKPDPWGYQTNPADAERKRIIIERLNEYGPFMRALDLGCGEGWITADLPVPEIWGWDISAVARSRIPAGVNVPDRLDDIAGKFDLILATGVLYDHYSPESLFDVIARCASRIVLTCHITISEMVSITRIRGRQVHLEEFPYRGKIERLRIFEVGNNDDN